MFALCTWALHAPRSLRHASLLFIVSSPVVYKYINSLYISSDTHLYIMRGRRGVNLFETGEDENV